MTYTEYITNRRILSALILLQTRLHFMVLASIEGKSGISQMNFIVSANNYYIGFDLRQNCWFTVNEI